MHVDVDQQVSYRPWKVSLAEKYGPTYIPIIVDAYRCHMMASVVSFIQDMGIQVLHIPGGCTYLCQPLDVGVNRPLKHHMTEQWDRSGWKPKVLKLIRNRLGSWLVSGSSMRGMRLMNRL